MEDLSSILHMPRDDRSYESSSHLASNSLVGIEVELEGIHYSLADNPPNLWTSVEDGSLRNYGVEFKFSHPYSGVDIIKALTNFDNYIKELPKPPVLSDRTSLHVHVDIRDLSVKQFKSLIILYMVFERVLYKYCGEYRKDNIFCLSLGNSETDVAQIRTIIQHEARENLRYTLDACNKYSMCNLRSAIDFGSVEFRGHSGTYDSVEILNWVNILLSMKKYIMDEEKPLSELPSLISTRGVIDYLDSVFGEYSESLKYEGMENDMIKGIRLAQDAIFADKLNVSAANLSSHDYSSISEKFKDYIRANHPERTDLIKDLAMGVKKEPKKEEPDNVWAPGGMYHRFIVSQQPHGGGANIVPNSTESLQERIDGLISEMGGGRIVIDTADQMVNLDELYEEDD